MRTSAAATPLPADTAELAGRIERALAKQRAITQKRMFGGLMFLLHGNMLCCASKTGLLARVGKDAETEAGRRMPGYVLVAFEGVANDADLAKWLQLALHYVKPLPPK